MGASLLERGAILPPPDAESLYATKMYAVDLYINIRDQYVNMNVFAVLCMYLASPLFEVRGSLRNPAPGVRWS